MLLKSSLPLNDHYSENNCLTQFKKEIKRINCMYNDLLHLLESKKLKLQSSEIHSFGERLVKALRDTLWYVDGHHEAFSQWSTAPSSVFKTFKDYNCPEKNKAQEA